MVTSVALQRSKKKKALKLFRAGKSQEAKQVLMNICRTASACRDAEIWCLLGTVHGELGDFSASQLCCARAVDLVPAYVEAHYNLGQAHMHMRQTQEAIEAYRHVVRLLPTHPEVNNNLGLALSWIGCYEEAVTCYQAALDLNPANTDALLNLGEACQALSGYEAGIEYFRRALNVDADNFKALMALGLAWVRSGKLKEAADCFSRANKHSTGHEEVTLGRAYLEERKGDYQHAFELMKPLLDSNEELSVGLVIEYAKVAGAVNKREDAIYKLEQVLRREGLKVSSAKSLHFELGKLYDKLGDYSKAFAHFENGNTLDRRASISDEFIDAMKAQQLVCSADFFNTVMTSGNQSPSPIFIIGMPRSGTTLTEQILASHPQAHGCGERRDIGDIVARWKMLPGTKGNYPECLRQMDKQVLAGLAKNYLGKIEGNTKGACRIIDKMPHNFVHLSLIALLFPNARIIHCKRNPLDTCLSIYTYEFNLAHPYSTDLRALGCHYQQYEQLMAHWKKVLPLPIFEVQYEDMIADQEKMSRALVEFCGLAWDDACLKYYESQRVVNTFSYHQVRKPIYTQSINRWRNYATYLKPLQEVLDNGQVC